MGHHVIMSHINNNRKKNMHIIISRIKFNHNPDSYWVEAQSSDEDKAHQKLKALQLLNDDENKTFHLVTVI